MAKVIKTTFQLRRGTLAEWEEKNPVLALGEPGFVTDKFALKVGDGATAWLGLPWVAQSEMEEYVTIEDILQGNVLPPIASEDKCGIVLSSNETNEIKVDPADGSMEVNSVSIDKVVTDGITMVLDGGNASALV